MTWETLYQWQVPMGERWVLKPVVTLQYGTEPGKEPAGRRAIQHEQMKLKTPSGEDVTDRAEHRWVLRDPTHQSSTVVTHRTPVREDYFVDFEVDCEYSISGGRSKLHRTVEQNLIGRHASEHPGDYTLTESSVALVVQHTTHGKTFETDMREAYKRALFGERDDGKEIPEYKKPWLDAKYGDSE